MGDGPTQAHGSRRDVKYSATVEDEHVEHGESDCHSSHSDESLVTMPRPSSNDTDAPGHNAEASEGPSSYVSQDILATKHTDQLLNNTHKSSSVADTDYSPGPPCSPERLTPADNPAAEADRVTDSRREPDNTTNRTSTTDRSYFDMECLPPSLSKPRSYERLRPKYLPRDLTTANIHQPAGIRKIFGIKPDKDPNKSSSTHQKSVKFAEPSAPSSPLYAPTSSGVSSSETLRHIRIRGPSILLRATT